MIFLNLVKFVKGFGAAILTEKSRNEAFVEYKNKAKDIISDIVSVDNMIDYFKVSGRYWTWLG